MSGDMTQGDTRDVYSTFRSGACQPTTIVLKTLPANQDTKREQSNCSCS